MPYSLQYNRVVSLYVILSNPQTKFPLFFTLQHLGICSQSKYQIFPWKLVLWSLRPSYISWDMATIHQHLPIRVLFEPQAMVFFRHPKHRPWRHLIQFSPSLRAYTKHDTYFAKKRYSKSKKQWALHRHWTPPPTAHPKQKHVPIASGWATPCEKNMPSWGIIFPRYFGG